MGVVNVLLFTGRSAQSGATYQGARSRCVVALGTTAMPSMRTTSSWCTAGTLWHRR